MENDATRSKSEDASALLNSFERALQTNPCIDEIGFIHPIQFPNDSESRHFWIGGGKLAVSTDFILPLYKAANDAFFAALRTENCSNELIMKHSKSILLLNSDFSTAWNARKMIISVKQELSSLMEELDLSAAVLSHSPKSDQSWCHRRWVIKMMASNSSLSPKIVEKELELAEKMAERSKMNYRAWNHRCWLVSYMSKEQVESELGKGKSWASLHVADHSSFHYRQRLLGIYINRFRCENPSELIKEELKWNEQLIKRYVGREALWLHRRVIWLMWSKLGPNSDDDLSLKNEMNFVKSSATIHDTEFEDFEAQAFNSVFYLSWLLKCEVKLSRELWMSLKTLDLKSILQQKLPERYTMLETIL